jgi:hypothetical protein
MLLLHRSGLSPHTPCQSPGALTRVAACTLARSPYVVTAIRRLQTPRLLHVCFGRFRLERSPGGACTHWKRAALSRRTWKANIRTRFLREPGDFFGYVGDNGCYRCGSGPRRRCGRESRLSDYRKSRHVCHTRESFIFNARADRGR